MRHINSINSNRDFSFIYKKGESIVTPLVVIYYRKNRLGYNRVGITATKKIGNAVIRNRCRRIIREAYISLSPNIVSSYDFVFVARGKTPFVKSYNILSAINGALSSKGLLVKEK